MNIQYQIIDHLLYSKDDSTQSGQYKQSLSDQSYSTTKDFDLKHLQIVDQNRSCAKKNSVVQLTCSSDKENFQDQQLRQMTDLQEQLSESKKNASNFQKIIINLMQQLEESRIQRDDLLNENTKLLNDPINSSEYAQNQVLRYQNEIRELKDEIQKLQKFKEFEISKELEISLEEKVSLMIKQLERKDKEIISFKQQIYSKEEELSFCQTEKENWRKIAEDYQRKFEILKQETITTNQQIQLYQDEQRIQNRRNQEFEYRINLLLVENEKLNKLLQERLDESEKMKLISVDWRTEKKNLCMKYETIINEKSQLLLKEKQTMEKNQAFIINSNKQEFQRQISILSAQNQQLNWMLNESKQNLDNNQLQLDEFEKKCQQMNQLIQQKEDELEKLYEDLDNISLKNDTLEQEFEKFQRGYELEKENFRNQLVAKEKKITELNQQLNDFNSKCCCSNNSLEKIEQEVSKLMKQKIEVDQKFKSQMDEKNELISKLSDQLQEKHVQLNAYKQEIEQMQQQNSILKQELYKISEMFKKEVTKSEQKMKTQDNKIQEQKIQLVNSIYGNECDIEDIFQENVKENYILPTFKQKHKQNEEKVFMISNMKHDEVEDEQKNEYIYCSKSLPPIKVVNQQLQHEPINKLRQYTLSSLNQAKSYAYKFNQQREKKFEEKKIIHYGNLDTFGNRERSISCLDMLQGTKINQRQLNNSEDEDEKFQSQAEKKYQLWQQHQKEHYLQPVKSTPLLRIQKKL